jgi:hypothetical protein
MGILTEAMKQLVEEQRLGYVATVCPDGTPNLSPKGTIAVWDDDHLIFGDICSPATVANLRSNPSVEINVVDVFARKGFASRDAPRWLPRGRAGSRRSHSTASAAPGPTSTANAGSMPRSSYEWNVYGL